MKEKIVKFEKSKIKEKKYTAYVKDLKTKRVRQIHFGADGYEQYKDSTGIWYYTKNNHGDPRRRRNYFSRHSHGIKTKKEATIMEIKNESWKKTPKIYCKI